MDIYFSFTVGPHFYIYNCYIDIKWPLEEMADWFWVFYVFYTHLLYSIVVQNICGKNLIEVKLPIVNCKSWDSSPCKMSVYILHFTLAAWNGHLYVSQKRHRNARSLHNVALHTTTENLSQQKQKRDFLVETYYLLLIWTETIELDCVICTVRMTVW